MSEKIVLGTAELFDAKRLKSILSDKGIALELVSNPEKCSTGGCKVTVELHARPEDVPIIVEHLQKERSKLLEDLNFNPELHEQTFDTNQQTAICPACGTTFSTTKSECPDCGLVFVPPGLGD